MALRRGVRIETDRHMGGMLIHDQVDQGIGKAKLRIGVLAFGRETRAAHQGIVRAENERHGIQEK